MVSSEYHLNTIITSPSGKSDHHFRALFHQDFFHCNSDLMEITFHCNGITGHNIATNGKLLHWFLGHNFVPVIADAPSWPVQNFGLMNHNVSNENAPTCYQILHFVVIPVNEIGAWLSINGAMYRYWLVWVLDLFDAETGIIWDNLVNTMSADALAACAARSSAAMTLTLYDKWVLVLLEEGFLVTAPFQCLEIIDNTDTFLYSPKCAQHDKVWHIVPGYHIEASLIYIHTWLGNALFPALCKGIT